MRAVNTRLIVVTLALCSVAALGSWSIWSWQIWRTAPALLQRSAHYEGESDYLSAAQYIRRYLKLRPNDAAARIQLAETYTRGIAAGADRARAIDLLYEALGVAKPAQYFELRTKLAELLLETDRYVPAKQESDKLIVERPEDANALSLRARAIYGQLQTGLLNGSAEQLSLVGQSSLDAIGANPGDRQVAGILAFAYRERPELLPSDQRHAESTNRARKADLILDQLVAADSQSSAPYITRHLYRVRYKLPGIIEDLNAAIEKTSLDLEAHVVAARYYHRMAFRNGTESNEAIEKAIGFYQKIIDEIDPSSEIAFVEMGELLLHKQNVLGAIECWQNGLDQIQNSHLLHLRLAEAHLHREELEPAKKLFGKLKQIVKAKGLIDKPIVRTAIVFLEAKIQLKSKCPDRAIAILVKFQSDPGVAPSVLGEVERLKGQAYSELKDWNRAALAYERALGYRPSEFNAIWFAATAWTYANHSDRANRRYLQLLERVESPEIWFALARSEFEIQKKRPVKLRQWVSFKRATTHLKSTTSGPLERPWRVNLLELDQLLLLTENEANVEKLDKKTIESLKRIELNNSNDSELLAELATYYQKLNRPIDVERILDELSQVTNRGYIWKLASARVHRMQGNFSNAYTTLQAILDSGIAKDRSLVLNELVMTDLESEFYQRALDNLTIWHALEPENPQVRRTLASTLVKIDSQQNWTRAIELLSTSNGNDERDLLTEDTRLKAQLFLKRGRPGDLTEALRLFELIVTRSIQSTSDDRLALAQLLQGHGKTNEAQRHYLQILADPNADPTYIVAYIEFLLKHKPAKNSIKWLEKLKQLEPRRLRTLVLEAKLAKLSKQPINAFSIHDAANQEFRKEDVQRRSDFCLAIGDLFNQFELPREAEIWHRKLLVSQPDAFGPLALTLARQNRLADSIQLCQAHWNKIETESAKATVAKVVASVITLSSPSKADLLIALSMIEQARKSSPTDVELLLTLANVDVVLHQKEEAIQTYRRIIELDPKNVIALNNLATLLGQTDESSLAVQYIKQAIALAGPQPALLDTLGVLMLANGSHEDALRYFEQAVHGDQENSLFRFHLWAAYRNTGQEFWAEQTAARIDISKLGSDFLSEFEHELLADLKLVSNRLVQASK